MDNNNYIIAELYVQYDSINSKEEIRIINSFESAKGEQK